MKTKTFTVFTIDEWQDSIPEVGGTVDEICEWYAQRGHTPIAWCTGSARGNFTQLRAESLAAGRTIELVDGKFVARGVEPKPYLTLDDLVKRITPENCHADAWNTKPAQTLGDQLRKALDRLPSKTPTIFELRDKWNREHGVTFSRTPTLDKLEAEHAGNARMIARDGPARIAKQIAQAVDAQIIAEWSANTAKPALLALTYSPDLQPSSHQVGPAFGSALLRG